MIYHLDTDFLVWALSQRGPEQARLIELSESGAEIQMSAVAWYEFCRGPRTPPQLAVAKTFLSEAGVIPFSEPVAEFAAELFRQLKGPRNRTNDIAIAATAIFSQATLLTRNARDFADVPQLRSEQPR